MKSHPLQQRIRNTDPVRRTGRVCGIFATYIEADGPNAPLGTLCEVEAHHHAGRSTFQAEIIRVDGSRVTLSTFEDGVPTFSGAQVTACGQTNLVPAGQKLLGRVVDALGHPADGAEPILTDCLHPLYSPATAPLDRTSPSRPLETGVRAIDGLLTLGEGQRIGLFAASGVGKTSLIMQIARQTRADITIICLVGERGREVENFWHNGLSPEARERTTMVAATSDQSAVMRVRAVHYALALADYWRLQGAHVLLLLDSATRLAMAMREVGLAAGEPPTVRAYTPSVFSAIPKVVERCGALRNGGSITAIMTVLSETDDMDDPICEMMKSLLDGHILLSRELAEQGHFPAIDIPRSISRQADGLISRSHRNQARQVVEWLSTHHASRILVNAGMHVAGANPVLDQALDKLPALTRFLRQDREDFSSLTDSAGAIDQLVSMGA